MQRTAAAERYRADRPTGMSWSDTQSPSAMASGANARGFTVRTPAARNTAPVSYQGSGAGGVSLGDRQKAWDSVGQRAASLSQGAVPTALGQGLYSQRPLNRSMTVQNGLTGRGGED